eukprot:gene5454-biopygen13168
MKPLCTFDSVPPQPQLDKVKNVHKENMAHNIIITPLRYALRSFIWIQNVRPPIATRDDHVIIHHAHVPPLEKFLMGLIRSTIPCLGAFKHADIPKFHHTLRKLLSLRHYSFSDIPKRIQIFGASP